MTEIILIPVPIGLLLTLFIPVQNNHSTLASEICWALVAVNHTNLFFFWKGTPVPDNLTLPVARPPHSRSRIFNFSVIFTEKLRNKLKRNDNPEWR